MNSVPNSTMAADRPDLQTLVENPRESLEIEVKNWIDLKDNVVRANIARHIAALANHGGGHLIFGFKDQTLEPNPNGPSSLDSFSRDEISSIVKRYLVPTFQCEVYHIESTTTKIVHPVVWVPSHDAMPICTKADGPADENGRGIRAFGSRPTTRALVGQRASLSPRRKPGGH